MSSIFHIRSMVYICKMDWYNLYSHSGSPKWWILYIIDPMTFPATSSWSLHFCFFFLVKCLVNYRIKCKTHHFTSSTIIRTTTPSVQCFGFWPNPCKTKDVPSSAVLVQISKLYYAKMKTLGTRLALLLRACWPLNWPLNSLQVDTSNKPNLCTSTSNNCGYQMISTTS